MIDDQSDPGSWADAIAHSPCLRVETHTGLKQAIADVEAGRVGRICEPGKWVVWRAGDRACFEVFA